MKRKTITIQFITKGILLLKNNEIKEYLLKSVDNYKIINKEIFIFETINLLKENNINTSILTDNLNIITDNTYSNLERELIEKIFIELSFNKINFMDITKILNIKKNELLIDLSTNNIKLYYLNEVIDQKIYFNKYKQILNILLRYITSNYHIKSVKLFGNKCNDKDILQTIEKIVGIEVYTFSYPNLIPIKLLT